MPVKTVIDNKTGIAIRTVTGDLTYEEIKTSYEESLTHPNFQKNMDVIWDLRDADTSKISKEDVIRIARYFEPYIKNGADYKAALVVSRDLEYGLSRMYTVAVADLPVEIGIFRSLEEAKNWVTESA